MAEINIDHRDNDGFGRYKMPRLLIQVEKGSRTVLCNLNAVAKALDRSPTDLSKFLRCQLSTRVTDRPKEDRYIFSGVHSQEKFQSYIYDYIDRFVRCTVCGNPETTLSGELRMDAKLRQACKACGYGSTIHIISHKLATLRLEQPSDQVENTRSNVIDTDDDDDESESSSTSQHTTTLMEYRERFADVLKEKELEQTLNDAETVKKMISQPELSAIKEEAPFVAAQCLLKQDIIKELDHHKVLFTELCSRNAKGQQSLLRAVEDLFWKQHDVREKNLNKKAISKLLLKLYDDDMVEEASFYAWYETVEHRMKELANDFIQWLHTAEESSGEEQ